MVADDHRILQVKELFVLLNKEFYQLRPFNLYFDFVTSGKIFVDILKKMYLNTY